MNLLVVNGSPRPRGNTWTLLNEAASAARESGANVTMVELRKLQIKPCEACDTCHKALKCRLMDDMTPLYDQILDADAILVGTPVYFWSMSAQMKAFVDRWYALDLDPIRPRLVGKRLGLVTCYAEATERTASGVVFAFRSAAEYMAMQWLEPVLATAGYAGEVAGNAKAMQAARNLGCELVSNI